MRYRIGSSQVYGRVRRRFLAQRYKVGLGSPPGISSSGGGFRGGKVASHAPRACSSVSSFSASVNATRPNGRPLHSRYDSGMVAMGYPGPVSKDLIEAA